MNLNTLNQFRHALLSTFDYGGAALFELSDALLTETGAHSLPELSLSPFYTRQFSSLYKSLELGQVNRDKLRQVLAQFAPLQDQPGLRAMLGVDASHIARPLSPTARDRSCVRQANLTLASGSSVLTYGWQFSTIVLLPAQAGSATYILDNTRIPSELTPAQLAAKQLEQLSPLLPAWVLLTGDRYYGSAKFVGLTRHLPFDKLLRIKSNSVFYRPLAPPAPQTKRARGAPRKDGAVFKCKEPATQEPPDEVWEGVDGQGQALVVEAWDNLHFRPLRELPLKVLKVQRQGASDKKRDPKVSWFVFVKGKADNPALELCQVPSYYKRRYSQEHGYRFDKQALMWEKPRLRTPEEFQVWTDVVSAVHDELVLAAPLAEALRRKWESASTPASLSQKRRGVAAIIRALGSPVGPPKGRGKGSGRAVGAVVRLAPRFEVVRKGTCRRKRRKKRRVRS